MPSPISVDEGYIATFDADADSDIPEQTLTFSLSEEPVGSSIDADTGVFSWTPAEDQGPGSYTFDVVVSDGLATDSQSVKIDVKEVNAAPAADDQSVSTDEDTPRTIMLSATDSDWPANSLVYSIVSDPSHGSLGAISENEVTYTPAADYSGADSFAYLANDGTADSNVATISMTVIDQTPPISTISAAVDGNNNPVENNGFATSDSVTFTFHADDSGSGVNHLECNLDSADYAICSSPHTESDLAEGRHVFSVRAIDNEGNIESTAVWTFTVDTQILEPIIASPADGTHNISEQTVSGTAEQGSSVQVFDGEMSIGNAVADVNGIWSLGPVPFSEGSHSLTAIATDAAGNASPVSLPAVFTIDITSPDTSITSSPANPSNSPSSSFSFASTEDGSIFQCQLDGGGFSACESPTSYDSLLAASHTFDVKATDAAGNTDPSAASYTWTVDLTAPTTTASPPGGLYSSNQTVTLSADEPATIYYTTDGSAPDTSSAVYSDAITIASATTLQFFAVDNAGNQEALRTEAYAFTGNFIFAVSPTVLPSVAHGNTSAELSVSVTSPPDKTVPGAQVIIQGLGAGMTAEWKKSADETFTSFSSPLQMQPEPGETEAASIVVHTSAETQPTTYVLQITAIGDGNSQIETRSVQLIVDPQSQPDQTTPSLAVSPGSGMAGDSISLEGTGFTPGSTIDQITIGIAGQSNHTSIKPDGTLISLDAVDHWNAGPIPLPSGIIPGVYVVKATSSDSKAAQATFQVLPPGPSFDVSLSTGTISVQAGDSEGVDIAMGVNSANGFSNSLELTVSNLPLGMSLAFSDVSGNVIMTASGKPGGNNVTGSSLITPVINGTLPIVVNVNAESGAPSGTYQLFFGAKDPTSGESKARLVGVTVTAPATPTITFSPLMAQPGSSINVLGSNFGSSESITIQFNGLNSGANGFVVTPSPMVTAAGGTFSASFTVPSLAGGIYQVVAASSSGQAISTFQVLPVVDTATVQLQIAPKALVLPAGSDGDQTITVVPVGQFSSDLQLTATPEASGLDSITFLPASTLAITPGIPSPVGMQLSVSAGAVPGSLIPVRVEAAVDGSTITTEYAYVRVADAAGDFFMSASPIDFVAARGTTVNSSLALVTTGLSGSPTLSLSGLPVGITGEILNVTPTDAAGTATATVQLSVQADAPLATSIFTLHGSFAGLPEKQISMSISVVSAAPISVESGVVDPTTVSENMPLYLAFPFGDGGTIELVIYSLATSTYGTTNIDYLLLPEIPDGEAEPTGYSLLLTGGANLDSANPFVNVDYDIRVTMPGIDSANLNVGFLDTSQDPPIWTPLPTSSTFNGDQCGEDSACATGVTHFSSWGLLAAAAAIPPASDGSSDHGSSDSSPDTSHSSSGRLVVIEHGVVEETGLPEEPIFDTGNMPIAVHDVILQPADTLHEDDALHDELAVPDVSNALITPFIETERGDAFYAGKWKVEPHVTGIDPLAAFFEPTVKITIVFDIEPMEHEGSAGATAIRYDIVDENQRVVFSGELLPDEEISESAHEKVVATVPSSGVYSLVLAASSQSSDTVQRMEVTTIAVPWLTAHISVIVEILLVIAAGFIGYGAFRHSSRKVPEQAISAFDRCVRKIQFSIPTVIVAVVGLMLVAAFFILFAGDKAAQETAGMWVTNVTTSIAAIFAVILFVKKRSGPHAKIELALAIGLVLWLGSRAVETWFNMVIPTLLSEEVLHHVYPGDFLLTFVTGHDLDVFNEALGGNFGWIYGLFTALKMGGFALFNFHLIKASRLFADRYGMKLPLIAMIVPAIFLAIIAVAYVNVLLGQILLQDLAIHFGYVILISMMMVPSTILLVVLRKDTKKELFWILSTLSLLSFVVAYSWQAFVPVGPDPEQYLEWLEQNVWLSALLFGGDYLLMAFALLWEIRSHKMEHHESVAGQADKMEPRA